MPLSLWDHLNNVTYNKVSWDSLSELDKKSWSTFMINRFLSMNEDYLELVNEIQRFYNLKPKEVYNLYCSLIPREKKYTPYIKSNKKEYSDNIKHVAHYYEISEREAGEYVKMLSEEKIQLILNSLGLQEPKKKKDGKAKSKGNRSKKNSSRTETD